MRQNAARAPRKSRSVPKRIVRALGLVCGGLLLLVAVLLLAAAVYLNSGPGQRLVMKRVNALLAETFAGRVELVDIGHIDLDGVAGVDAKIFDPFGKQIADVRDLDVRLNVLALVRGLLGDDEEPLVIRLERIELEHTELELRDDGTGSPTLARTFEPKRPAAPTTEPRAPGRPTIVSLEQIAVEHAWVHGGFGGSPRLDVDLRRVQGSVRNDETGTQVYVKNAELAARALPRALNPRGTVKGRLLVPRTSARSPALSTHVAFDGRLAEIPVRAELELDEPSLHGWLRAERIEPARLAALVPGLSPSAPLGLRAEVRGPLPELSFDARIEGAPADLRVSGRAELGGERRLDARVVAERVDLAQLSAGAPPTRIALVAETSLRARRRDGLGGSYRIDVAPSELAGQPTPPIAVSGVVQFGPGSRVQSSGDAAIDEPGAPARLRFSFVSNGQTRLEIAGPVTIERPRRLQAQGVVASGRLDTDLRWNLSTDALSAAISGKLRTLQAGSFSVSDVALKAQASGSTSNPKLAVAVQSGELYVPGRRFARTRLDARGSPSRFDVEGELFGARPARIAFVTAVRLDGSNVSLEKPRARIFDEALNLRAEAGAVHVGGGRVEVRDLTLDGAGRARLSLRWGRALERFELSTRDLDLARLARLVDPNVGLKNGRATLEARYVRARKEAFVRGRVERIALGPVADARLTTDLTLRNLLATGSLSLTLPTGDRFAASFDEVGPIEPPLSSALLRRLRGKLGIEADGDLAHLATFVPPALLPLQRARGRIEVDLALEQRAAGRLPDLDLRLQTAGLELTGKRERAARITDREQAVESSPWTVQGVDVSAELGLDGNSGAAQLDARLSDRVGELLDASLSTQLAPEIMNTPSSFARGLWTTELEGTARVPPRELELLPNLIRPAELAGVVSLVLEVRGSLADPTLRARGELRKVRALDVKTAPLDVDLELAHERGAGKLRAAANANEREVATLGAEWRGPPSGFVKGDVVGGARLRLDRFPLDSIPALQTRSISGEASGTVVLSGLGEDAALEAELSAGPLHVQSAAFDSAVLEVNARGDELKASAKLSERTGSAQVSLRAALDWGDRLAPELSAPARARLVARGFQLAALSPLTGDFATELEGRLDADLTADLDGKDTRLQGTASVRDGVVNVGALGQRFHHIRARVSAKPGELRLEELVARGTSGRLVSSGVARFDGTSFRGAQASVRIPRQNKLPLTMEGVAIGDAWGRVELGLESPEQGPLRATVNVPQFELELPRSVGANVQNLDPPRHIEIGMQTPDGFVELPVQPLEDEKPSGPKRPLLVAINFGNRVWVRKGAQGSAQLTGNLTASIADETRVTGRIRLTGGNLDVSGKKFEIESGTITFDGDQPENPIIVAVARWDAPDGEYRVYAEYTGRVQTGTLRLRSEPNLSQDQILSLILFGSPEGHFGTSPSDSDSASGASAALGVAGSAAAQGLSRALSDITNLDVSARIDTSSGSSRPEIMVQLSPRVVARLSYAVGEPSAGQSPDRTFLTVELRLRGNWGISTTVGDKGASAIDLIWRRRY